MSANCLAHAEREIDQRLRLIFRAVFLGEAVHDGALAFARRGQRHVVIRLRSIQHPGDHAVLAFINRRRRAFAAQHAIHRFDRQLAGMRGSVSFPGTDFAFAGLPRGEADVNGLLHGLINHLLLQSQQRPDPRRLRGTQMTDVIDLVLMQRNRAHQIDLDFIAGGQAADQIAAGFAHGLRDREDRRDVVAGMRVIGGEKRIVHVQLSHRGAVGPGGPFRGDAFGGGDAEHGGAVLVRTRQRHIARRNDRTAVDRGDGDRGVVDDAIDDHRRDVLVDRDFVGGDTGDLPGELVLAFQIVFRRVYLTSCVIIRFLLRARCGQRPGSRTCCRLHAS